MFGPIYIGGVGGLLPSLIKLVNMDANDFFTDFDLCLFSGYCLKTILLSALGAFWVWFNNIDNKWLALQVGIAAPSLIVTMMANVQSADMLETIQKDLQKKQYMNTGEVSGQGKLHQTRYTDLDRMSHHAQIKEIGIAGNIVRFMFASPAYAQDKTQIPKVTLKEKPGAFSRFLWGVTGNLDNSWFVIVGSHKDKRDAQKQVDELKAKGYAAEVYKPNNSKYYGVVIGSWLNKEQAQALSEKALKDGLPKDTYLWKAQNF